MEFEKVAEGFNLIENTEQTSVFVAVDKKAKNLLRVMRKIERIKEYNALQAKDEYIKIKHLIQKYVVTLRFLKESEKTRLSLADKVFELPIVSEENYTYKGVAIQKGILAV